METHFRSILKAISWRAGGTVVTMLTVLLFVGKADIAIKIGLVDTLIKISVFYFHERLWNRINYGKIKPPEYHILKNNYLTGDTYVKRIYQRRYSSPGGKSQLCTES